MSLFKTRILASLVFAPLAFSQQGAISGTVVDSSGAAVARADVKLLLDGRGHDQEVKSSEAGEFSFAAVAPGAFRLSFAAQGLAVKTISAELPAGQALKLPATALAIATVTTGVTVTENTAALAEAQIKEVERDQRFGGIVPNFFANYNPDAAPLNTRQKFELTWKTYLDPSSFVITGIIAGAGQATNSHKGFGQGAQGYAKHYGSSYVDFVASVTLDKVIMPTIFRQDPRYFVKSTGSTKSRVWHSINRTVICQGDNKKAQFCYSSVISRVGAGFATNYLYPAADRNSNRVILRGAAIGFGAEAMGNLFQEFVARKLLRKKL